MPVLTTMQTNLRLELSDSTTFWSENEVNRAIAKSESLLSRAIPKKAVKEVTITHEITGETLTIASSTATTTYKPVESESEVVTNTAGTTTYTRGTDFTIDYMTGVVTEIGSQMPDASYKISYHKDPQRLDLGTLLTNPLKITRVEYPVGDKPPTYLPNFDLIEDYIIFGKDTSMTTGEHLRIYYDAMWTGAATATGEYPENLADIVIIGAAGQALLMKAEKYVQSAITELALSNAAADSMATPLADINTALDKVTTYLETYSGYNSTTNARGILNLIEANIADLRTAIETALDKAATYVYSGTAPSALAYLSSGDDYIITVNVADQVSAKYSDYSRACVQLFNGLVAEATQRLDNIRSYIEEAGAWTSISSAFIAEATQRVAEAQAWGVQADKYITTEKEYLTIAGRYLASGQAKVNEFYALIGNKPEIQQVRTSPTQATAY